MTMICHKERIVAAYLLFPQGVMTCLLWEKSETLVHETAVPADAFFAMQF